VSSLPRKRLTAAEFIAWATTLPKRPRYELVDGEVVAMAPERSGHALTKARVWRALDDAVRAGGLECAAYPDGMAVEIDERTVYEPDALVRCGPPLDDDAVRIVDPILVVEVLSPSSEARDAGAKLADYARVTSIRHYLIVDPKSRVVVHHRIEGEAAIRTAVVRSGPLVLDPPGIAITVEAIFP
jgi:Uma2 family endonuclease